MMKREFLKYVDLLFEREALVQSFTTAMFVLAAEYWSLVGTPNKLGLAISFTLISVVMVVVYAFWDTLEAGFEQYFGLEDRREDKP